MDLSTLDINSRRTSTPTENYYAVKADEHYEIGGTFSFQLDLDDWTEPIDLKYELWDTDWWNDLFASGTGDTCSYTFASGDDGDVIIRYYIDTNGDDERDWGEPTHTSEEFWVQECKAFNLDVEYSDKISDSNATIEANIVAAFANAESRVLRKDSADDYRACVDFTVDSKSEFTADEDTRPDPVDADDEEECELHMDVCEFTVVETLYNAGGICRLGDFEIIIGYDNLGGEVVAHEIGHGADIAGDYDALPHSDSEIMWYRVGGTADHLIKNDAEEYDD